MDVHDVILKVSQYVSHSRVNEGSARVCLDDALKQDDLGNDQAAFRWALKSLAYSVGIMNADFKECHAFGVSKGYIQPHQNW